MPGINKFEEIKAQRDGLDVSPDISRDASAGWEAITDDDKTRLKCGKMGSGGFTPARSLNVFVEVENAEALCIALVLLFRNNGPREARSRARLAFLLEDWALERLREELESRCGWTLEPAGLDMRRTYEVDHIGLTPLRERNRYAVGLAVPVGRLHVDQVYGLANLADEYGGRSVRDRTSSSLEYPPSAFANCCIRSSSAVGPDRLRVGANSCSRKSRSRTYPRCWNAWRARTRVARIY